MSTPVWLELKRRRLSATELLEHFGIVSPPVDVEWLARRMGVQIVDEIDPSLSGRLESSDHPVARATIFVNRLEPARRQRFTVAHELGHLMKHSVGELWRDTNYRGDPREREANNFAAALLMPPHMVEQYAQLTLDPRRLAGVFDVGVQAMEYRLANLGLS